MYEQTVATRKSKSWAVSNRAWPGLWLGIFMVALVWRAQNLDAFGLSNDEGAHLMWARLAVDGYPLYSETQAVQAPLFIESIGWAFKLAGQTIQAGRWVALTGFSLLAVMLSWLAYQAGGWPASLTSLVLVALSPLIFAYSRLAMGEVPATAMSVVSVALIILYLQKQTRAWLVASGLALGLSFMIKALNIFVVVPLGFLLLLRHTRLPLAAPHPCGQTSAQKNFAARVNWHALIFDLLLWGIGLCVPLIAVLVIYEPAAIFDQLVTFRRDLRAAVPGSWPDTRTLFRGFIGAHWGFWLLAVGGIISTVLRAYTEKQKGTDKFDEHREIYEVEHGQGSISLNSPDSLNLNNSGQKKSQALSHMLYQVTWIIWLGAGVAMLAWHTPLFPHHFIVLLPPLILLGASSVANLVDLWPQQRDPGPVAYGAVGALLLIVIGAALNGVSMVRFNQQTAAIVTGGREQEALQLLEAVSNPDDFIMGDSQLLIFMANRRTPPPLGDVALVAIKAGRQTSAKMMGLTDAYQSPAVVQWSLRLPWLPKYVEWVEANYLARQTWDNDHIIYFGRHIPEDRPLPNEQYVRVGDWLALRGYDLDPSSTSPGKNLRLQVYWQTEAPLPDDYTVFTQLLDGSGMLVTSKDSQPLSGYFPTSQWPEGEIITDLVRLPLPKDLPAGDYTLITGMYLWDTLERLPVLGGASDHVTLTTIRIE